MKFREVDATEVVRESASFCSPTPGNISVRCPVCGGEYVHVVNMREVSGHDDYRAGWWGRGHLNVIGFEGECGHVFELCFGNHKGYEPVFCRVPVDAEVATNNPKLRIEMLTDIGKENPKPGVDISEFMCEAVAFVRFRYVPLRTAERAMSSENPKEYLEARGHKWIKHPGEQ